MNKERVNEGEQVVNEKGYGSEAEWPNREPFNTHKGLQALLKPLDH